MFGFRFWSLSALYTAGSALLLGIPTLLIPNHLFSRIVPTSPQDYVIWIISALLLGPLLVRCSHSFPLAAPSAIKWWSCCLAWEAP